MKKTSKTAFHSGKQPVSAFSVYTAQASTKRKQTENHPPLQDVKMITARKSTSELEKMYHSKSSSSLVRQLSSKAIISLKRGSMKRKKKSKTISRLNTSPALKPSCVSLPYGSMNPMFNFCSKEGKTSNASTKNQNSGDYNSHTNGFKMQSCDAFQPSDEKRHVKMVPCSEDPSIELSSSRSLSGFEDENLSKNISKKNENVAMNFAVDISPQKKVRLSEANGELKESRSKVIETQLHGNEKTLPTRSTSLTQSSSSFTTVFQKASSLPVMPFPQGDSENDGKLLLEWLLHPVTTKKFFTLWEKKPLLVRRHVANYAEGLFSSSELNRILMECNVRYGVNLDITTYQNGVRETHNIEGRAYAPVVWDYYKNDCSIRLKNPQAFSKPVWKLCSTLQEYFKSMVGANIYLTPPGSQGFAPHYDDIEAFVLQLEGKKHWKLYNPRNTEETLPRYSSRNFDASEIGKEMFSTTLEPGDLLYFPRGVIHQAKSLPDCHSLHITISTYQKNTWGDFLEELVPLALSKAIAEDVEFRKGLPLDYLSCLGVQNSDKNGVRRKEILQHIADFFRRLADHTDPDFVADQRGVSFLHDALPPALSQDEKRLSILGADVNLTSPGCPSAYLFCIDAKTRIRILRKNAVRLCVSSEADANANSGVRVYHCIQNSRVYHEEEKKFFEIEEDCAPALEFLIHSYPDYVPVGNLPLSSLDEKINLATALYEKGILVTEEQLKL